MEKVCGADDPYLPEKLKVSTLTPSQGKRESECKKKKKRKNSGDLYMSEVHCVPRKVWEK